MHRSVDWLTVSETRPDVGDHLSEWSIFVDPESGEVIRQSGKGVVHEGSYDTRVLIRALAGRVEWSGNPSRFNRPDNVYGLCFADAWEVVQSTLRSVGLPEFTVAPCSEYQARSSHGSEFAANRQPGAVVSRVDLADCWSVGSPDHVAEAIRRLSTLRFSGHVPSTFPGSLRWGSKRGHVIAVYDKAAELAAHRGSKSDYLNALIEHCRSTGVLRVEHRFGVRWLHDRGVRSVWSWLYGDADSVVVESMERLEADMCKVLGADMDSDLYQVMLSGGVSPGQADRAVGLLARWRQGYNVKGSFGSSRKTWYRYRRLLLDHAGIDISDPVGAVVPLQSRRSSVSPQRSIAPSWHWTRAA